jgi:FkbM family methyltransferase
VNFSGIPRATPVGKTLRAALRLLPTNLVVPILQGRLRGKRWIVGAGVHGYWLGSYEWEKRLAFEAAVPRGGVVYDVGSNVGYYALLASELVGPSGKVVAFEPLARNLWYLEKHLSINHLGNVLVSRAAAWDRTGNVRFDPGPDNSQGSAGDCGAIEISAITLDDFRALKDLPFPNVIKMDIEGGEYRALNGAIEILTHAAPTIFLATHGAEVHKNCCELLKSLGYELRAVAAGVPVGETDELVARKPEGGGVDRLHSETTHAEAVMTLGGHEAYD